MASNWEFHFRNCDVNPNYNNWFGVCHFGCGGDLYDGRECCWDVTLPPNPQGGDNSVYCPAPIVVDAGQILQEVLTGLAAAANYAVFLASGGDDVGALAEGIAATLGLYAETVEPNIAGIPPADLQSYLNENLALAASVIGMTPEQVTSYAQDTLGLAPGTWGFISGEAYWKKIHDDNSENGDCGWSVMRGTDSTADYIANGAWLNNGHLIYMWDRWLLPGPNNNDWGGKSSLWLPYPQNY